MGERIIMYEKRTCTTCRKVADVLRAKGVDFERVDYTIDPIPREKLVDLVVKMGVSPRELLRKRHPAYAELNLGDEAVGDDAILDAMATHPELVQRPILERGNRAVLARPPERAADIF